MDAIEVIKTRRSIRAFQSRPVPRDVLSDLVDCARLAPTAMNQQPWEFVIVTHADTIQQFARLIGHAKFLPKVPAVVVVLSKRADYSVEDASAATQNILLAARAHGLGSCWVVGDRQPYADDVRKLLGAPADVRVFSLVAVGYPDESPNVEKRSLHSLLHWEKF